MNDKIKCPQCGSDQISANKKGFSGGKAVAGAIVAGPIGIAAGTLGSNKVKITCLNCGNDFKPGDQLKKNEPVTPEVGFFVVIVSLIFIFILFWILGIF